MENQQTENVNELQILRERISHASQGAIKLYFIVRMLKERNLRRQAVMGKYTYKAYQIDIKDTIRGYIYSSTIDDLDKILKKDFTMLEYDPIAEDTDNLFTYSMKGKGLAFADVVENQLCRTVERVSSLKDLQSSGIELWAYCVGFEEESGDTIYTFRKVSKTKVAVQDNENPEKKRGWFNALLNPSTHQLEMLEGEVIALDRQVDCVYVDEAFYILRKVPFEQIVGIQEEFKEKALEVVSQLESTNRIEGLSILRDKVNTGTGLHKKLAKIAKNGGIPELTTATLSKMQQIGRTHGNPINIKDDKIQIESEADLDSIIKMLGDYYKIGEITGKSYGTFAGKVLAQ